jgi:hypothetical protein
VSYARSYFHEPRTHTGYCPADEAFAVNGAFSPGVQRWAVRLAGVLPYTQAEAVLVDLAGVGMSDTAIWHCVQQVGQQAEDYLAAQAAQHTALPNPDQISTGRAPLAPPLGVSLDGAKFLVRGEGWKEAKIGCVFGFAPSGVWRQRTDDEPVEVVQAKAISYVFHLGPPEPFGQRVWAEADRRGWLAARQTAALGDGAAWIWHLADFHFLGATPIVDWYHAKQHLWEAAHLIYGLDSPKVAAFVKRHEKNLYEGQVDRIAHAIQRPAQPATHAARDREATYFTDNRARMQYRQFQAAKLPIGSGTVESGCKQFKARFAQAGMRWSRPGAIHLMPWRAALMSNRFDQLWQAVCP